MQSAGMVFGRTITTIGIFLTFYSKRASHRRCQRFSGLKSSSKLFDESLETITPAIGISINPLYSSYLFMRNCAQCSILSMSTLTDLQRNKCNILPREIITYDPLDSTMKLPKSLFIKPEEEKRFKARTHTNTFGNDYFYPCHYFPPQMHLSEFLWLHVQIGAVGSG